METYIFVIIAFLIGGAISWFYFTKKIQTEKSENSFLNEQINSLKLSLEEAIKNNENFRNQKDQAIINVAKLETELKHLNIMLEEQKQWLTDLNIAKSEISEIKNNEIKLQENLRAEREKIEAQQKDFLQQKESLSGEFKLLANQILEEKSIKFSEQSKKDIGDLIDPMKEKIEQFKKQVTEAYSTDEKERFSLKNEIEKLQKLNQNLSQEAHNLTKALKGDNKTQGDWGEMILEKILESSGLTKGREYTVQQSVTDEDNKRYRPDVVVNYPGNRCVIIDSKVSLKSYEAYVNAKDEEEQKIHIKAHIDSIKKHIKDLSAKNYQDLYQSTETLDFVMMFLPIEPAYILAVQNEPDLWNHAYQKQILFISPTNLITALRMIAQLWEHEKQNKNVQKIAEESGKLVDKFVGFLEDFDKVGDYLNKSNKAFSDAKNKMKDGRGNIIEKANQISKLGASTKKSIPQNYLDSSENTLDF